MLLLLGPVLGFAAPEPPANASAIWILNSYSPGYQWSDAETEGVVQHLQQYAPGETVFVQYLDSILFPDASRQVTLLADLLFKKRTLPPKLIITLDDSAFAFTLKNQELLGPDVPIVFGGLNRFTPDMLAGHKGITGVSEAADFNDTLNLIETLQPGTREIVVISTQTPSGLASRQALEEVIPQYAQRFKFRFFDNWSVDELYQEVARLKPGSVGLLIEFSADRTGRVVANDATIVNNLNLRASAPIYRTTTIKSPTTEAMLRETPWLGVGGRMVPGELHGDKVGEFAVRVLLGESPDRIPVMEKTPFVIGVSYPMLERYKLEKKPLPPGTQVFFKPQTYYQINPARLLFIGGVLLGLLVLVGVLSLNILRRKRAESELLLLKAAIEHSRNLILILDARGTAIYGNPTCLITLGLTASELPGKHWNDLLASAQNRPDFATLLRNIQASHTWEGTLVLPRPDEAVSISALLTPLKDSRQQITFIVFLGRDISRETKLEEQVRRSQKMEAVGLLAGGIAHDFNNILQAIKGSAELLGAEYTTTREEAAECRKMILDSTNRAIQLTRQLLVFGQKQSAQTEVIDINELLNSMLMLLRRLIGAHIEIILRPAATPCSSPCDKGQIEQVLLNLCLNARDAMPQGGRIILSTQQTFLTEADAQLHADAKAGPYTQLIIEDTGTGMDPATIRRIFDPFFTTKPVGKGTGLGLSVVYGVVKEHAGFIKVYSEPGRGSVFHIYLPATALPPSPKAAEPASQAEPLGSGTVLLAEDDPLVQKLATHILRKNGFTVIVASDGQEAIDLLSAHAASLRLAVLDAIMPRHSGKDVYDALIKLRPDLPILFCSGYSKESLPIAMAPGHQVRLLSKPYTASGLISTVHQLLDSRQ